MREIKVAKGDAGLVATLVATCPNALACSCKLQITSHTRIAKLPSRGQQHHNIYVPYL